MSKPKAQAAATRQREAFSACSDKRHKLTTGTARTEMRKGKTIYFQRYFEKGDGFSISTATTRRGAAKLALNKKPVYRMVVPNGKTPPEGTQWGYDWIPLRPAKSTDKPWAGPTGSRYRMWWFIPFN